MYLINAVKKHYKIKLNKTCKNQIKKTNNKKVNINKEEYNKNIFSNSSEEFMEIWPKFDANKKDENDDV